ncbi:MAG: hypothetical protein VYC70_09630, partial [Verrucomicrobiota bacterium]|nr:hypothetical protein [Verrucomicrobiota bacterium]
DVSDVAEILEGDQASAEKICSAARKIDLEGNVDAAAENASENENNDDNDQLERTEESAGSEVDEVEKESEGELESV